jgi:hypothetical protein
MGSGSIAPSLLISALYGREWSASRQIATRERAFGIHWIGGWMRPSAGLDTVETRILSCLCPSLNRLSYPGSLQFCGTILNYYLWWQFHQFRFYCYMRNSGSVKIKFVVLCYWLYYAHILKDFYACCVKYSACSKRKLGVMFFPDLTLYTYWGEKFLCRNGHNKFNNFLMQGRKFYLWTRGFNFVFCAAITDFLFCGCEEREPCML